MGWTQHDSILQTVENPVDIVKLLNRYFYLVSNRDDATMTILLKFPVKIIRRFWKPLQMLY